MPLEIPGFAAAVLALPAWPSALSGVPSRRGGCRDLTRGNRRSDHASIMNPVSVFLLVIAAIFVIGVVGEWSFEKSGVPDVVWLIEMGLLVGPIGGLVSHGGGSPGRRIA